MQIVLNKPRDYYSSNSNSNQYLIFGRLISDYAVDIRNVVTIVEDKERNFSLWYPDLRGRMIRDTIAHYK